LRTKGRAIARLDRQAAAAIGRGGDDGRGEAVPIRIVVKPRCWRIAVDGHPSQRDIASSLLGAKQAVMQGIISGRLRGGLNG
jgi:hypothetical protein